MKKFAIPDVVVFGDEVIDKEHQAIVDLVLGLERFSDQCNKNELETHCDLILSTFENHFVSEEMLMAKTEFPGRNQHCSRHVKILGTCTGLLESIIARGQAIENDIMNLVSRVIRHMLMDDVAFRDYLHHIGHLVPPSMGEGHSRV